MSEADENEMRLEELIEDLPANEGRMFRRQSPFAHVNDAPRPSRFDPALGCPATSQDFTRIVFWPARDFGLGFFNVLGKPLGRRG